uniref:hypothetical protein n=1 Tax=Pedobacter schmidteae TaxID=2201271 RepID=UPI000EB0558C|nr:hypothetical protein [Pedobacter schmidteae]
MIPQGKKIKLLMLFVIAAFTVSSCKKVPTVPGSSTAKISFKVGTVQKQASGAKNVTLAYYKSENTVQVLGMLSPTEGVSLMITNFNGVGEYTGDNFAGVYMTGTEDPESHYLGFDEGSLKVTSFTDNVIKGEFKFTGENLSGEQKIISEGTFEGKMMEL